MREVVNGREAPRWAFKLLVVAFAALLGWFFSDQTQAAEVRSLGDRVTSLESMKPQMDRIERRVDDIYTLFREESSKSSGRGTN